MSWSGYRSVLTTAIAAAMLAGCGRQVAEVEYQQRIQDPQAAERVRAIVEALERDDRSALPLIVDRLDDEDAAVRLAAVSALREMTGQDFGYQPYGPLHERVEAVERWRTWLKENRISCSKTRPKPAGPPVTTGGSE